jgi:hypothetical protein
MARQMSHNSGAGVGSRVVPRLDFSKVSREQSDSLFGAGIRPVSPGRIRPRRLSQGGVPVASKQLNPTPTSITNYAPHHESGGTTGNGSHRVPFSVRVKIEGHIILKVGRNFGTIQYWMVLTHPS